MDKSRLSDLGDTITNRSGSGDPSRPFSNPAPQSGLLVVVVVVVVVVGGMMMMMSNDLPTVVRSTSRLSPAAKILVDFLK